MKCPYRTVTITTTVTTDSVSKTDFCDCYGIECPWYCGKDIRNSKTISEELCQRCHVDYTKAQAYYENMKVQRRM